MNRQSSGFTLIELVAVILMIGILAATALPKFIDISGAARTAKLNAALAALKSAAAMTHGKYLVNPVSPQLFEGVAVTFVNGYPAADSIAEVSGLSPIDFTLSAAGTTAIAKIQDNCTASYTEAASAILPPTIVIEATGC